MGLEMTTSSRSSSSVRKSPVKIVHPPVGASPGAPGVFYPDDFGLLLTCTGQVGVEHLPDGSKQRKDEIGPEGKRSFVSLSRPLVHELEVVAPQPENGDAAPVLDLAGRGVGAVAHQVDVRVVGYLL